MTNNFSIAPTSVPPRVSPSSVPSLLLSLQQEWEASALETHSLRIELDKTRKELAASLYKNDSAYRVISKLLKEKEELHKILNDSQLYMKNYDHSNIASLSPQVAPMELEEIIEVSDQLDSTVLDKLTVTYKALSATRKGRKPSPSLLPKEDMKKMSRKNTFNLPKKITTMSYSSNFLFNNDQKDILLASLDDFTLSLLDVSTGAVLSKANGHKGYITSSIFTPKTCSQNSLFFTSSEDSTVRVWSSNNNGSTSNLHTFLHSASVNDLSIHPSGSYLFSAVGNGSWSFLDIERKQALRIVKDADSNGLTAINTHPDGLLISTGSSNGTFKLWDLREQKSVANISLHQGALSSIAFSENGYLCATGDLSGQVQIVDLRKLISVQNFNSKFIHL